MHPTNSAPEWGVLPHLWDQELLGAGLCPPLALLFKLRKGSQSERKWKSRAVIENKCTICVLTPRTQTSNPLESEKLASPLHALLLLKLTTPLNRPPREPGILLVFPLDNWGHIRMTGSRSPANGGGPWFSQGTHQGRLRDYREEYPLLCALPECRCMLFWPTAWCGNLQMLTQEESWGPISTGSSMSLLLHSMASASFQFASPNRLPIAFPEHQ